jgi:ribonucleoside-diphosphate reductase alpha chain
VDALPEEVRNVFAVSADITADEHVRMQAALQAFVDNSLSKTINFPPGTTDDEVANAYMLAWELGCKGITVYVTGSRDKVVLETHATAKKKEGEPAPEKPAEQTMIWHEMRKPRPQYLPGYTYSIETPLGRTYITVNENGGSQPFEVFLNSAKAGSDTAAVSEAIGRLISYILRMSSSIEPSVRLREITKQLGGIGGGRPLGFGPNRVRSLPDGIAQILERYLDMWDMRQSEHVAHPLVGGNGSNGNGHHPAAAPKVPEQPSLMKIGDLCPECGQAAVVNEEGCRKCYACGFSEC